jgi:hypothetical protein
MASCYSLRCAEKLESHMPCALVLVPLVGPISVCGFRDCMRIHLEFHVFHDIAYCDDECELELETWRVVTNSSEVALAVGKRATTMIVGKQSFTSGLL